MIERIRFKNFKALKDAEVKLGSFNLIVGPNGSGKSSLLQAFEGLAAGKVEGMAGSVADIVLLHALELHLEELGVDPAAAAELPFGADELIDQGALDGAGGLVVAVEVFDQGLEVGGVLTADDLGLGVDAGFEGVETGSGLTLGGAWACRLFGVAAIGLDLFECSHFFLDDQCQFGRGNGGIPSANAWG